MCDFSIISIGQADLFDVRTDMWLPTRIPMPQLHVTLQAHKKVMILPVTL
jgi:hypothetical protein